MKVNRDEFDATIKAIIKQKEPKEDVLLLKQSAVEHKKLINDPKWTIFQQELQTIINDSKESLGSLKNELDDIRLPDVDIRFILNKIYVLNERIGTLTMAIDLPKNIIQQDVEERSSPQ